MTVFFTPGGNCTDLIVQALRAAKPSILVQAYSFTSVRHEAHRWNGNNPYCLYRQAMSRWG
jgi:hypothetical protein